MLSEDQPIQTPKRRPTLRDVASIVGVSVATVSYVLNNKFPERVSTTTRRKVLKAAEELNYTPNSTARSLVTRRSATIGVYIPRPLEIALGEAGSSLALEGILQKCTLNDYAVQIAVEGADPLRYDVDGWVCLHARAPIEKLERRDIAVLYLDPAFDNAKLTLSHENLIAGKLMGEHLATSTKKAALILAQPESATPFGILERRQAFCNCLKDSQVKTETLAPAKDGAINKKRFAPIVEKIISRKIDTVIAQNDELGALLLSLLLESGKAVPADVQVAAFADASYGHLCYPSLTVIEMGTQEMGYRAAHILLETIGALQSNEKLKLSGPPRPTLQIGGSTRKG